MPHINGVYRGLKADAHMAYAAAQYRRSKASQDIENIVSTLAGDVGTKAIEKYHDRNQSRIRDIFVEVAPRILEALVHQGANPLPIVLKVRGEVITLTEEFDKLVLLDDAARIYRVIPGKNYETLKRELAIEISAERHLYGDEAADWATLIAYDLNGDERMDANTGRVLPPYEILGLPVDLWHVVANKLNVHSLLSLGTVSKDFDLAVYEAKHQVLLKTMIRRLSGWTGVGERLVESLVRLSAEYRREPLEQLVARLSSASLPELRMAGRTLLRAARWLSQSEREFALSSMVALSAQSISKLPNGERANAFLSLLYVVSRSPLAHREAPLEALAAQISALPQCERLVTFNAILTQVGELDPSCRAPAMTLLGKSICLMREKQRTAAFSSVLDAVNALALADREQSLLALAGQISSLRPCDRSEAFTAMLEAMCGHNSGHRAKMLTVLVNTIGHLPEDDRLSMLQRSLDAIVLLESTCRKSPLQAATALAPTLSQRDCARALHALISVAVEVEGIFHTTVLLEIIRSIGRVRTSDVHGVFVALLTAIERVDLVARRSVLTELPRVIDWMPNAQRPMAFDVLLAQVNHLRAADREGPLETLARRVGQLGSPHRGRRFEQLFAETRNLPASQRVPPLRGLLAAALSLPRHQAVGALRALSAAIDTVPLHARAALEADYRRQMNILQLL